jgi:hypothetical protein
VQAGPSEVLVRCGEPGIGKIALSGYAAERRWVISAVDASTPGVCLASMVEQTQGGSGSESGYPETPLEVD